MKGCMKQNIAISSDLTWHVRVENILSKKKEARPIKIYLNVIRPVLDYTCPALNTCLKKYLFHNIEMAQEQDLRSICPSQYYCDIIDDLQVPSLAERRENSIYEGFFRASEKRIPQASLFTPRSRESAIKH